MNLFDTENPLVSIRVFNYNYGRYLRECLESAVNQTYPNIEICFSDNCSADESWEIALEYQRCYPKIFSIARNASNKGVYGNIVNCVVFNRGRYMLQLCSDDALADNFIEKCVNAFKQYPECGMVMVNRDIMDESALCPHRSYHPPHKYLRNIAILNPSKEITNLLTGQR